MEQVAQQLLREHGFVLLEYSHVERNGSTQLRIVGDREIGNISIEDCAQLTRELRNLIIEQNLLSDDFRIEVSSPGLDYPLREDWQFRKNVGRLLKVRIPGAKGPKEIRGRLVEYDENTGLTLQAESQVYRLERPDVLAAVVLPEFKKPLGFKE